ncbi:MAG: hypothetical protein QUS33_03865 [Dehalococcoidia bacterium]|nr:hypothetical protein [Dehalococcoidia bacterium]
MLRKMIDIPDGIYYRGRFRAAMTWSKARGGASQDSQPSQDQETPVASKESGSKPREPAIPVKVNTPALQATPIGSR